MGGAPRSPIIDKQTVRSCALLKVNVHTYFIVKNLYIAEINVSTSWPLQLLLLEKNIFSLVVAAVQNFSLTTVPVCSCFVLLLENVLVHMKVIYCTR